MAAGSAQWNGGLAELDPECLTLSFDGTEVFRRGVPTGDVPALGGATCAIDLDLGLGDGEAAYLASDLSYDYVKINAEYTT
jgi:glutamate N-acetyltransferase / amino-acid N-acetyltransferase